MNAAEVDRTRAYQVEGFEGIAFAVLGPVILTDWETGEEEDDPDKVRAVMIGDDRVHVLDVDELVALDDDAYCHVCGQVGCTHDGRS